ncbi:MAG: proline dehydrogenase family protein, partial [Parachlamydiaceae bacterium]
MQSSTVLGEIKKLMNESKGGDSSDEAIILASMILTLANQATRKEEKEEQLEIHRMMEDPIGKPFTMALTDQGFRTKSKWRAADQIAYLIKELGVPAFLTPLKRYALYGFRWLGKPFFPVSVPFTQYLIRQKTKNLIILGEESQIKQHIEKRKNEGVRINLNHLGEAILGEEEAKRRLEIYLKDLKSPSIDYISVKISTLYSQINLLSFEETLHILSERFLHLLVAANANKCVNKEGRLEPKFVNLDMEEYKDLDLTVEVFKRVLDRPECLKYSAGIVLQAYLPDSFEIQKDLTRWAKKRKEMGGAPIKIRLVKGANLAMEELESSMRGWASAPYESKGESDANFKRMLNYALDHIDTVHIGVGSHNLFDISYALIESKKRNIKHNITFEMLEGMAEPLRRTLANIWDDILLYCPASKESEFQNAVAYLVRRLDENTAPHNFLRHIFHLVPGSPAFNKEAEHFKESVIRQNEVSTKKRRQQDRLQKPEKLPSCRFINDPDTDLSLLPNRIWANQIFSNWEKKKIDPIPNVIGGEIVFGVEAFGFDPSRPDFRFTYHLAEDEAIENALKTVSEIHPIDDLSRVVDTLRERRQDLIGAMILNTGKNFFEADSEVSEAIDFAAYYLRQKENLKYLDDIEFKPKGGVLIAPPWNFSVS